MYCISSTGVSPSAPDLSRVLRLYITCPLSGPQPRRTSPSVWALSISLAATLEIDFSFSSSPYLDVSVQEVPSVYLCIQYTVTEVFSARFPHSDIHASLNMCFLTWLFAAYHVLHRLPVPRHPPCALLCLTICFRIYSVICFRFD